MLVLFGYHLFNITNPSPFYIAYPGLAVLAVGTMNILKGIFKKKDSKTTRSIETGIGITAIVVGVLVFTAFQTDVLLRSSWLLSLFVIIQGVGFVGRGITQRNKAKMFRISMILIGIAFIVSTELLSTYPDRAHVMIGVLLSLHLFLIGIEIITGAMGNKIAKSSQSWMTAVY